MNISPLLAILNPQTKAVRTKQVLITVPWRSFLNYIMFHPTFHILQTCVHCHINLVTLFIQSNIFPHKSHLSAK